MDLLTAQDLAKELRLTVDTVWRYTRMGRIPCLRLGDRDYRYRLDDVLASLAAPPSRPAEPPRDIGQGEDLRKTDPAALKAFAGGLGGVNE